MIAVETHPSPARTTGDRSARVVARRYLVHPPGFVYLLLTILLVLGAVNSQNNLLFAIFGLAVAGIIISGIVSGAAIMGLRVRREIIVPADAGKDARVLYHIRNTNWLIPAGGVVIEEIEVDRRRRHRSTWPAHTKPIAAFLPWVRAHEEATVEGHGAALARGRPSLNLIRLSTTFPFGLTRKYVLFSQPDHLLIRPWVASLREGALAMPGGASTGPRAKRITRAADGEFFAIREYARGDSPRAIAWKPSARRGQLVVREHAEVEHRRIVLEVLPGSLSGSKLELFISAIAGFVSAQLAEDVDLSFRCAQVQIPLGGGSRQFQRILNALATLPSSEPDPDTSPSPTAHAQLTIRSLDGGSTISISSSDLVAACERWNEFPMPPARRNGRKWHALKNWWRNQRTPNATTPRKAGPEGAP